MDAAAVIDRRRLLGLLSAAGIVAAAGCSADESGDLGAGRARPSCVASSEVRRYERLADLPLVYEISQRRTGFRIQPAFAAQLTSWLQHLPAALGVDQVWTYGAWIDGGTTCDSWHHSGRAFDLSRLRLRGGTFVSCRYDQWSARTGAALDRARRTYWSIAAGLHRDFAYVLTYLYDAAHHNHIHVDNGVSGSGRATFSARSGVQVQAAQAICSYLWDRPVELTGRWDGPTRSATSAVLDRIGAPGRLTDPGAWTAFTQASSDRFAD